MYLIPMTMLHADKMLEWKNYEETRQFAITSHGEIKKEDHYRWLKENIQYFQVILNDYEVPVGAVRIQDNEVSIWIDREYRKRRYAYFALKEVVKPGMTAKVVIGNLPSMRLFLMLGFLPIGLQSVPLDHFILQKS